MIRLYLVRHGETEFNYHKNLCGWSDVSLNGKGRLQAQRLASAIKDLELDIIYTSDLKRTKETAEYILKDRSCSFIELDFLREMHFGDFEGHTMVEIETKYPEDFAKIREDSINYCFPSGESMDQMHKRVTKGIDDLLNKSKEKNILLVAHSGVIRSTIAHLLTGDIKKHWNFKINHCTLSVIERVEGFNILTKLNEEPYNYLNK
ncbi:alpha-ribazole phosphatase [Alkaliphilus serpentinus]|uniref:Alpha-ribazole phosphatase n=1 Tax=Alkaliphilus serpentinus TaxID=1482731 RepID=A0A833HN66_9FIRM|nr:alpha-ribazole phosphatase [Alkaliphilus serpentinus]KAB3529152.1 alpha-ribazole phosphatase [Alkaliphilus serpentinus]